MTRMTEGGTKVNRKAGPWFRSWRAKLFSPKIWQLSDTQYRTWDMLLCMTDANGYLPPLRDIAHHLRLHVPEAQRRLADLVELQMIDPAFSPDGSVSYRAHDWDQWQRFSDNDPTNALRQSKFRKRRKTQADRRRAKKSVTRYVTDFCSESESVSASENHNQRSEDPSQEVTKNSTRSAYARAKDGEVV